MELVAHLVAGSVRLLSR